MQSTVNQWRATVRRERDNFQNEMKEDQLGKDHSGFLLVFNQTVIGTAINGIVICLFVFLTFLVWSIRGISNPEVLYNDSTAKQTIGVILEIAIHVLFCVALASYVYWSSNLTYVKMKMQLSIMLYTVFRLGLLMWIPVSSGTAIISFYIHFNITMAALSIFTLALSVVVFAIITLLFLVAMTTLRLVLHLPLVCGKNSTSSITYTPMKQTQETTYVFTEKESAGQIII